MMEASIKAKLLIVPLETGICIMLLFELEQVFAFPIAMDTGVPGKIVRDAGLEIISVGHDVFRTLARN